MQMIKKITAKNIFGKKIKMSGSEPEHLFRVLGQTIKTRSVTTQYGESSGFVGQFKAIDAHGNEFRSNQCFLPEVATNMILGAMACGDGSSPIAFAFDIGIKEADTPTGYEFTVESALPMDKQQDPLAMLEAQLTKQPALPAPEKKGKK